MKLKMTSLGRMASVFLFLAFGCRSPLQDLRPPEGRPFTLAVPPAAVEDHSRTLKRLRDLQPDEKNAPEARKDALEAHRAYLDAGLRNRLAARGIAVDPLSPYRLELTLSTVGEVRTKYIVYGILSGVAWGVGTGLATHNVKLALGLGGYELVEESLFWIAGSSLFGRFSAPVVLEARLLETGRKKALWEESYYVIWGGKRLKEYPEAQRGQRSVQIMASLDRALDKLCKALEVIPNGALAPSLVSVAPAPSGLPASPSDAGSLPRSKSGPSEHFPQPEPSPIEMPQ